MLGLHLALAVSADDAQYQVSGAIISNRRMQSIQNSISYQHSDELRTLLNCANEKPWLVEYFCGSKNTALVLGTTTTASLPGTA